MSASSVSERIREAWERLREVSVATKEGILLSSEDLVFARYVRSQEKVLLHTRTGEIHQATMDLSSLVAHLPARFVQSHGYYLVDTSLVHEVSGRPGDFHLHFEGISRSVPVSSAFEKRMKQALGVTTFEHPVPDNPRDRFLRKYGLIEFGERELNTLDKTDPVAVEAFVTKWDLKRFTYLELERFFRRSSMEGLNIRHLMRNMLWQRFRWIQEGIAKPHRGNIRTLWYEIQAGVGHHQELADKVHPTQFYEELETMVGRDRLFRYRDIGFFDVRSRYRGLGTTHARLLLISEKEGNFFDVRDMAEPYEMSYGCTKGQPSLLMMEYLGDELRGAGLNLEQDLFHVFLITDFDWAGKSIEESFIRKLKTLSGVKQVEVHQLIHPKHLTDEQLELARTRGISYTYNQQGEAVPWGNTKDEDDPGERPHGTLTKARSWFAKVGDPRLLTKTKIADKWVYTIWKFSSDAIGWRLKDRLFRKAVETVLEEEGRDRPSLTSPDPGKGRISLESMRAWAPRLPRDLR